MHVKVQLFGLGQFSLKIKTVSLDWNLVPKTYSSM